MTKKQIMINQFRYEVARAKGFSDESRELASVNEEKANECNESCIRYQHCQYVLASLLEKMFNMDSDEIMKIEQDAEKDWLNIINDFRN